jgi:hypothetical protein
MDRLISLFSIGGLTKKEKVINIKNDTLLAPEWIRKIITPNAYPKYKYEK